MSETQRKRHRQRPQLSCVLCKRRKVKCNRELPCDQCYKLSKGRSCVYRDTLLPTSPSRTSDTISPEPHVGILGYATQSRSGLGAPTNLDQTRYGDVPALLRGQHQHIVAPAFIEDGGTASAWHGNLNFLGDEWVTSFHGNSHWSSVFSQVRCIPLPSTQRRACARTSQFPWWRQR